eukprot:TRINITY_DN1157_c0_g3_i2.p2 TRINITY_DN1157_c0_g3~~TRINITY_DN1157_c0_g3_i2.p2  ORF type:complete len:243 (+),score=95.45 TRINITY_DN1157_c0_g3_i2:104-730(+)
MWVVYYKKLKPKSKKSKKSKDDDHHQQQEEDDRPDLTYVEAVEEALCFGWIDATSRKIDEDRWGQYFRPRKAGSEWSKVNKTRVEKLEKLGLMTDAGRAVIERAEKDGSWTMIDHVEDMVIAPDLKEALGKYENAETNFEAFGKTQKKMGLHWISTAKRAETRANRIAQVAENANLNKYYIGGRFKEVSEKSSNGKKRKKSEGDDDDE